MKKSIIFFVAVLMTAMSLNAQTVTISSVSSITSTSAMINPLFNNVTDTIFARAQWGDSAQVNEYWSVGYMITPGTTIFSGIPVNNLSPSTTYVCVVLIYYPTMIMSATVTFTTDSCGLVVSISSVVINSCSEQLTATGGFNSYQWKRNGAIQEGETDSVMIASLDGSYTVVVGNTTACTGTSSVVDVDVNEITVTVTGDQSVCKGNQVTLTASGASSYSWSNGSSGSSITPTPLTTTSYTVTGTSSGCSNTATSKVTVNPLPVFSVTASATNICTNSTDPIYLYPVDADFTENGNPVGSIFTATASSVIGPHDIMGTITDDNGCQSTDVVTLNVIAKFVINPPNYNSLSKILILSGSLSGQIQIRINNDPTVYLPAFPNDDVEATFAGITIGVNDLIIVESKGGEGCHTGVIYSNVPIILFGDNNLKDKDLRIFDINGNFVFDAKEKSDLNSVFNSLADGMYFQICSGKFTVVNGRATF
ncbi:MAG: hypothetical protein WC264_03180 [Candidatus Paceibacterota bacterium]|jgi:hypothetical protein